MLSNELGRKFDEFSKAVQNNDIIDPKTITMLYLASSMAVGCYPWMEHFLGVAEEKGITEEEIGVIQAVVIAISGGRVRAQFREVHKRFQTEKGQKKK